MYFYIYILCPKIDFMPVIGELLKSNIIGTKNNVKNLKISKWRNVFNLFIENILNPLSWYGFLNLHLWSIGFVRQNQVKKYQASVMHEIWKPQSRHIPDHVLLSWEQKFYQRRQKTHIKYVLKFQCLLVDFRVLFGPYSKFC